MDNKSVPYFISNRSGLIIPPANPKPIKARAHKKLPRRLVSALKNFLDLPLDIMHETFAYLEPLDLLNLSRLSKDFRALFLSRSTISIWRSVLKNVPNLPPCPTDLCEPEYASLMFEKFCMACGSNRGTIETYPNVRMRFCATCAKTNIIRGYALRTEHSVESVRQAVTIIPVASIDSFLFAYGYEGMGGEYSTTQNGLGFSYFRPELEQALDALEDGKDEFIAQQQAAATRMMQEGRAMEVYQENAANERDTKLEDITSRRYKRIKEEMKALGWNTDLYSPGYGDEDVRKWEDYLFQPKEFTMRSWQSIRPKLAEIYERTRRTRLIETLIRRAWGEYVSFRERQSLEVRRRLPPWADVCKMDFLTDFCAKHYEQCDAQAMEELMLRIMSTSDDFTARVEHELAHLIARVDPSQKFVCTGVPSLGDEQSSEAKSKDKGKAKAKADPSKEHSAGEILNRAANMFLCHCSLCLLRLPASGGAFAFPNIVNHVVDNATIHRMWSQIRPRSSLDVIHAARNVLLALGLSEDATLEEVHALGKFVCECGDHKFEGPLSYDDLVTHVYDQQYWTTQMMKRVHPLSLHLVEELVVDGHSLERLKDLVRVATDADQPVRLKRDHGSDEEENDDEEACFSDSSDEPICATSDIPHGTYCRYCYNLQLQRPLFVRNQEMMAYHVKYRHGKEIQPDDFEEIDALIEEYGEGDDEESFFSFLFPFL